MKPIIVTTSKRFTDIDGLACGVAYQEIPDRETKAVIVGPLNASVTPAIIGWRPDYQKELVEGDYDFVVVDFSDPAELPDFVKPGQVIEIYDHHYGHEKRWRQRLGNKAKIEPVGACATLIWEELIRRQGTSPAITATEANLLSTAIVSNTLNFKSSLTTDRDLTAYHQLQVHSQLPNGWVDRYYQDQEKEVYQNPRLAIQHDTKIEKVRGLTCASGQLELWNSRDFINTYRTLIKDTLRLQEGVQAWFFVSPCLSEGRSYIYTESKIIKDFLRQVMGVDFFDGDVGVTHKLWLRKEILAKIQG